MTTKTHSKASGLVANPNETLVRTPHPAAGLKVKTPIKGGSIVIEQ